MLLILLLTNQNNNYDVVVFFFFLLHSNSALSFCSHSNTVNLPKYIVYILFPFFNIRVSNKHSLSAIRTRKLNTIESPPHS